MAPRKLSDDELTLVAHACLGERARHFVQFLKMRIVGDEADTEPQPVADYSRVVAMLLSTVDYTARH